MIIKVLDKIYVRIFVLWSNKVNKGYADLLVVLASEEKSS